MLFWILSLVPLSLAQTEPVPDAPDVQYKKVTEIEIEEVDVWATVERPGLSMVYAHVPGKFAPMIQLRKSWDDQMEQSVDAVR